MQTDRYGGWQGGQGGGGDLADILERVLDKGVVVAGDIAINLLDIELLTIKLRLLIASADTARKMGIDWWEHDPFLNSKASRGRRDGNDGWPEGAALTQRLDRIESVLTSLASHRDDQSERGEPAAAIGGEPAGGSGGGSRPADEGAR